MNAAQNLSQGARAILQAATELFAQESFEAVSVGAIAERAGVSKSNVFHHFASKEELYITVVRETTVMHAEFAEHLLTESGSCVDKLRRLIEFGIVDLVQNQQTMQLILRAFSTHNCGGGHQIAERIFQRNLNAVTALFAQGQAMREFRDDFDPATAAIMMGGANEVFLRLNENLGQASAAKQRKTLRTYFDTLFTLLLHGVAAPNENSKAQTQALDDNHDRTSPLKKEAQCQQES